ncbi:MAG TPA: hypothetical protein VJN71_07430, partial [Nitrososphaerales archaeon]|nr:hypothetical protein [Nitrososphaerales archaeon]
TLVTHNFCFKDPVKCYGITSPLQYPSKRSPSITHGEIKKAVRDEKDGRKKRGWMKTRRSL